MSLPIPNLDDRSFDDLMKEARSLIPIYNKDWTNHNPSDPGIMLLELFAWLCEAVIYRIDQIPEENYRRFLALIGIEYVFCWEKVPGEDDHRLREFLEQNYGADWVKIAAIQKNNEGKTITISTESDSLLLALNDEETKVTMTFDNRETHDFIVKRDKTIYEAIDKDIRIFCWEKVPGEDDARLREFLAQSYGADWVKIAAIQKSDHGKTITISTESDSLLLTLNDEETKVTMTFDSGETYDLVVKRDKTIYEALDKDIQRGLTLMSQRHRAITSGDYEFLALECMEKLQKGLAGRAVCVNNRNFEFNKVYAQPGHVSIIIIPRGKGYVFNWDEIPGTDNNLTLLKFLMQIFGADWIRTAIIEENKDEEGRITKSISWESNSILLTLDDGEEKVIMTSTIYRSYQYDLSVGKEVENGQTIRKVSGYCTGESNPSGLLKDKVMEYLNKKRLITTRVHVVAPDYRLINLEVCLVLKENIVKKAVIEDAQERIKKYFDPLDGGQEGRGWPLGRNIYRSEIYHLLEGIPGIDHVEKILIKTNDEEEESDNFAKIEPYQLPSIGEIVIEVHDE